MSLVIILDKPVHQKSTEKPGKGPLSYPTAAQKSIKYRRTFICSFPDIPGVLESSHRAALVGDTHIRTAGIVE